MRTRSSVPKQSRHRSAETPAGPSIGNHGPTIDPRLHDQLARPQTSEQPVREADAHQRPKPDGSRLLREHNPLHVRRLPAEDGSRGLGSRAKGPRKSIDPSREFKELESRAVAAYINEDYDLSEELAQQAIGLNTEIFSTWVLLSNIYDLRGDYNLERITLFCGAHTRPRDPAVWEQTASTLLEKAPDHRSALQDAIYCYNRMVNLERNKLEWRQVRAELLYEHGDYNRAIADCKHILKQDHDDIPTLRILAQAAHKIGRIDEAIELYETTFDRYYADEPDLDMPLNWLDVALMADLYLKKPGYYDHGLYRTKQFARFLQGRWIQEEWDECHDDDSEFDDPASARRIAFQGDNLIEDDTYHDIPLPIRVKLGLFRLRSGEIAEAQGHFNQVLAETDVPPEYQDDYLDCLRDIAYALESAECFEQALPFFYTVAAAMSEDGAEAKFYMAMGNCQKALGDVDRAAESYKAAIRVDQNSQAAIDQLFAILQYSKERDPEQLRTASALLHEIQLNRTTAPATITPDLALDSLERSEVPAAMNQGMVARPVPTRAPAPKRRIATEDDLTGHFENLEELESAMDSGDGEAKAMWFRVAADLTERFRSCERFWAKDKRKDLKGGGNDSRPGHLFTEGKTHSYCGVGFADWLDCMLQYALLLVEEDSQAAYDVCDSASWCLVWRGEEAQQFMIHLVWSWCAVIVQDQETLGEVARFFVKHDRANANSYRLFCALELICGEGDRSTPRNHPKQKFFKRQLSKMDKLIEKRKGVPEHLQDGSPVALPVAYGHMLFSNRTYEKALEHYCRALKAEPLNPMILLHVGLAHIHMATKRTVTNRHWSIARGMAQLHTYYEIQQVSTNPLVRQEAEQNMARSYHMLGLVHLAMPFYGRCVGLSEEVQKLEDEQQRLQDFAVEAAYCLQRIHLQNGNYAAARDITEKWLYV